MLAITCARRVIFLHSTVFHIIFKYSENVMSGDTSFTCPGCAQSLVAESDCIGNTLDCPSCGNSLIVPSSGSVNSTIDNGIIISVARNGKEIGAFSLSQFRAQVDAGVILHADHIYIKSSEWVMLGEFERILSRHQPPSSFVESNGDASTAGSVHTGGNIVPDGRVVSDIQRSVHRELRKELTEDLETGNSSAELTEVDGDNQFDVVGVDTNNDGQFDVVATDMEEDDDADDEGDDDDDDDDEGGIFSLFD